MDSNKYVLTHDGELYHYGIKGMRWGVRRNLHKSGFRGVKKVKKTTKADDKTDETPKKKTVKDMSDTELREHVNRMRMEKEYIDLNTQLASLNARKMSAGEKFIKDLGKNVVAPVATNVGKQYLEKVLKEQLGLNEKKKEPNVKKMVDELNKMSNEEYEALKRAAGIKGLMNTVKGNGKG